MAINLKIKRLLVKIPIKNNKAEEIKEMTKQNLLGHFLESFFPAFDGNFVIALVALDQVGFPV